VRTPTTETTHKMQATNYDPKTKFYPNLLSLNNNSKSWKY
jgi:hypothetical protein